MDRGIFYRLGKISGQGTVGTIVSVGIALVVVAAVLLALPSLDATTIAGVLVLALALVTVWQSVDDLDGLPDRYDRQREH